MDRVIKYFRDREWALTIGTLTTILAAMPAILEFISGELDKAQGQWNWGMLLPLITGIIIRSNVWSRRSTTEVVEITAQEAATQVEDLQRRTLEYEAELRRELQASLRRQ